MKNEKKNQTLSSHILTYIWVSALINRNLKKLFMINHKEGLAHVIKDNIIVFVKEHDSCML